MARADVPVGSAPPHVRGDSAMIHNRQMAEASPPWVATHTQGSNAPEAAGQHGTDVSPVPRDTPAPTSPDEASLQPRAQRASAFVMPPTTENGEAGVDAEAATHGPTASGAQMDYAAGTPRFVRSTDQSRGAQEAHLHGQSGVEPAYGSRPATVASSSGEDAAGAPRGDTASSHDDSREAITYASATAQLRRGASSEAEAVSDGAPEPRHTERQEPRIDIAAASGADASAAHAVHQQRSAEMTYAPAGAQGGASRATPDSATRAGVQPGVANSASREPKDADAIGAPRKLAGSAPHVLVHPRADLVPHRHRVAAASHRADAVRAPEVLPAKPVVHPGHPEVIWARPTDVFSTPQDRPAPLQTPNAAPIQRTPSPPATKQLDDYAQAATSSDQPMPLTIQRSITTTPPGVQAQSASASYTLSAAASVAIQRVHTGSTQTESQDQPHAAQDPHVIAQQVYRILKQRLMLERERAGAWRSR